MSLRLDKNTIAEAVRSALKEDVGSGDITTRRTVRNDEIAKAFIYAQARGKIAGLIMVKEVFKQMDKRIRVIFHVKEGQQVENGECLCTLKGPAAPILTGERTALNFLGLMSGIATKTAEFVNVVKGTNTVILDTRKTIPGMRLITKYAVKTGGGSNHRMGLHDAVLIKDNHINHAGSITMAIRNIRKAHASKVTIEVEVETLAQVSEALLNKADIILLDNFDLKRLKKAVLMIGKKARTEISGGVTLKKLKQYVSLGVDRISVGAITHSAAWLPMHMEFE